MGIVRRPDPVPCPNCAVGEWDMCRNGRYTERGIKELHGFMSERWRIEPEYAIRIDPALGLLGVLLEPTSVIAKALEQVAAIGRRSFWEPRTVLVTGAGPIGLLAALAARSHGLEVHVLDRVEAGLKPDLVRALGATYHSGSVLEIGFEPDAIVECTGVGQVIADAIQTIGSSGIVCLQLGVDVLLEKPMTTTLAEADELIASARANGRILQIGHLERYNAALMAIKDILQQPLFIESHRIAPFKERGIEVDVILDLMSRY